jgi:disulfide bond formation protein DsbB
MKKHINIKHFLIRLLILLGVCIGTIIAVYLTYQHSCLHYNPPPSFQAWMLVIPESIVATIWFAIEAVMLQIRKNIEKRNANLLLLLLIFIVWLVLYVEYLLFNNFY